MPKMMPEIFSSPVITRYQEGRPILTKENVPYPAELIFNAGVTKYQGKYVMVFRDDYDCHNGFPEKTHLGLAFSTDGLHWEVQAHPMWNAEMLRTPGNPQDLRPPSDRSGGTMLSLLRNGYCTWPARRHRCNGRL